MSTGSFINAMRRFYAIRGEVKEFRSDRGTNFIGAADALHMKVINVEDSETISILEDHRTVWKFNPPHASHMGGVWERLIGVARRILDNMLRNPANQNLTHEVLSTLMAEVSAIINARPIVSVSTDPNSPFILTPSVLLTQKTGTMTQHPVELDTKEMYRSQWKYVQILANTFWKRWKSDYLSTLQSRQKWESVNENLKVGDIILLHDRDVPRNQWPLGVVLRVFPSDDGLVRKVEVQVVRGDATIVYVRPVCEIVKLLSV
ncbi:uncharacterized protein LOC134249431 [Saccostrea cucullata]|uniref:uncharacterized protein LOC134249431 n=1 Tax=Saccostrea cuccullata TaxID=36930 RepID=UPI002ED3263E